MADGFFGRWSRRKQDAREGKPLDEPAPEPLAPVVVAAPVAVPAPAEKVAENPAAEPPPAPTLADAQALTPASDFKPFVARSVAPEVRNAAMKKLFTDPHFNVMDGLDIYIDDYSQPDPLPAAMLRKMAGAQFLGLVPEVAEATALPEAAEGEPKAPVPATAAPESSAPPPAAPCPPDTDTSPEPPCLP